MSFTFFSINTFSQFLCNTAIITYLNLSHINPGISICFYPGSHGNSSGYSCEAGAGIQTSDLPVPVYLSSPLTATSVFIYPLTPIGKFNKNVILLGIFSYYQSKVLSFLS